MTLRKILFIVLVLFIQGVAGSLLAQDGMREKVLSFHSDIKIETDGKITVTEGIMVYAKGRDIKRGIVRSIPLYRTDASGKKQKMDFKVLTIVRNGEFEKWNTETVGDRREIYIGDRNVMLPEGMHIYVIQYESYGHIGFFDDFDELYWNVTGNDWAFPIDKASATVMLPGGASALSTSCYTGIEGSTASYCSATENDSIVTFQTNGRLSVGEGLTVAVSFPRDIIKRPPPATGMARVWEQYKNLISSLFFLLLMCGFYYYTWYKVGIDPQKQVPIPTFNPPHKWSATLMRYLFRRRYDSKAFTASLISLAVKGSMKINCINGKYYLEKKEDVSLLAAEERIVYNALFAERESLMVSDVYHHTFSGANSTLRDVLMNNWKIKDYYRYNRKYVLLGALLMLIVLISYNAITGAGESAFSFIISIPLTILGVGLILEFFRSHKKGCATVILLVVGIILTVSQLLIQMMVFVEEDLVTAVFLMLMYVLFIVYLLLIKAPTELGARTEAELEGFRMYLKTAEENRLNLLTPPDRTPELFEKLLPYAIALDVENEWGQKFDSVLAQVNYRPTWYSNTQPLAYRMLASSLAGSLASSFENSIVGAQIDPSKVSSSGSSGSGGWSSGSSGGGFSGGGGGGGGGRGW